MPGSLQPRPEAGVSRVTPYQRLLVSTGVSSLGDGIRMIAMPLMATRLTSDPQLITGVFVADRLPWLLFLLPGGALADRLDRLRMRVVLDLFRALVGGMFVALAVTGHAGLATVYAVTVLMSSAEAIVDSSSMALVPALADPEDLEHAVGQLQATDIVTRDLIGPALGGALFAFGLALPLAVDAISFAVSAAVAVTIHGSFRAAAAKPAEAGVRAATSSMTRSIRSGLAWLWRAPTLRSLAFLSTGLCMVATAFASVLVIFITDDLGLGAKGFGLVMVPSALGGVLGSWLAPRLRRLALGTAVGTGVFASSAAQVLIAGSSSVVALAVLLAVDTAGVVVWNVLTVALRQRTIPDEMLGRVSSSYRFLLSIGAPIGALMGGALASTMGTRNTLLLAGVATCVCGVVAIGVLGRGVSSVPAVPASVLA